MSPFFTFFGFPQGGSCRPQAADEGQPCCDCPLMDGCRKLAPHPAFGHLPPRGAIFYWFSPAATTAASAMELTFVWKESLRLVRMAGTLVPVRMQPFLQSAV
jgi:hypothetical protein